MRLDDAGSISHALDSSTSPWALDEDVLKRLHRRAASLPAADILALQERAVAAYARDRSAPNVQAGVAVLSLRGVITPRPSLMSMLFGGGGGLLEFRAGLAEAVGADEVSAILINVDSPGGSSALLPEVAAEIRAARAVKPIVSVANTLAASAAYWLASQADEVVVTPSGDVGSIGAYLIHEDWSKFNEGFGVEPTYITAGKYKAEANPDHPLSDEAREHLQVSVDECMAMFVADVAKGRGVSVAKVRSGYGEGRVLTAKNALAAGMVDKIATIEDTLSRLARGKVRSGRRADDTTPPVSAEAETFTAAEAREHAGVDPSADDESVEVIAADPAASAEEDHFAPDDATEPAAPSTSDEPSEGETDDTTSPPPGGVDPEQNARIADVLLA